MALDLRLSQKLDLQLKLAPQIIQSIEILQLPAVDLENLIQKELDTNEFLELGAEAQTGEVAVQDDAVADSEIRAEGIQQEREVEVERLERDGIWDDEMPRFKNVIDHEAADRKMDAMNNTADRGPSLHDVLLSQYSLLEIEDEKVRRIGERLVTGINVVGRLDLGLEVVADEFQVGIEVVEAALDIVQTLEPAGIGARTAEECLLLQLNPEDPRYEIKRRLVTEHLEDLKKNRRPKIAKSLGVGLDDLENLVVELAQLDYQPGRSAVDDQSGYIYPDVVVDWTPEGYDIRLAGTSPQLHVNPIYRSVFKDSDVPSEYKEQVRKQVDSAKWLISAIEQRQSTLLRVSRRIVHYQRDFLDYGPHFLRPLKMQQIADDLDIHVSTVSRATSEKYMQTHRGIFALKSFFSGATTNTDGGVESRASVKQRVKEIIEQEDKKKPLSDEEIVKRLKESFGVDVARRTITKYRKALDIPSTRQRRVY